MKVFIVTDEPFPNGMASTRRICCYARALMIAGIYVEVLCYHRTEIYGRKAVNTQASGSFNGIPFRYIGGTTLREANLLRRKFNDCKDKLQTLRYLRANLSEGDAILYYSVNQFPLLACMGWRVYRDLCEYPFATQKINRFTELRCHLYMSTLFRLYDGAICISKPLYDLACKYKPKGHHMIAPIFVDPQEWDFSGPRPVDFPYILHSGTLDNQKDGICENLQAFAKALPHLPAGIRYLFTKKLESSPDAAQVAKTIVDCGLQERMSFLGYLPNDQLCAYIAHAECFIANRPDNLQNRYSFSTKLGEYLLTGKPVITNDTNTVTEFLTSESSFVFRTSDIDSLSGQIAALFNDRQQARMKGENGRKICLEHFAIDAQSGKLKDYFCN